MTSDRSIVSGDFELTMDELREVARYVMADATDVLPVFEAAVPDDPRPRAAIEAARRFAEGAARTKLQRVTALDAHRAARSAPSVAHCRATRRLKILATPLPVRCAKKMQRSQEVVVFRFLCLIYSRCGAKS